MDDVWQSAASYEQYIGRWSREVARRFVPELRIPAGSSWLDVGSGSGALTSTIVARADAASVIGIDRSFEFVAHCRSSIAARFIVGDAMNLPFAGGGIDAVVSALMLNFVPEPEVAVREMLRCVRPGGTVATYIWNYASGMQAIRLVWDTAARSERRATR